MTPAPLTAEALVESLTQFLLDRSADTLWQAEARAKAMIAGPLSPLLAAEASLQRVTAERDEAISACEEMIRLSEMGFDEAMAEPEENGNYAAFQRAKAACEAAPGVAEAAKTLAGQYATATAEAARLRERLEIAHAYDGASNKIPFPEGMEHLDGIECRDETIRNLEEQVARLRGDVEAKDRALKDLRADAAELGARLGNASQYDDRRVLRDLCWEAGNFLARRVIRSALARAATEKGQADG